jgi:phage shock protein A
MALLERVSTLLRANVNDLIDKAEDPEKMLKQLLLDMENQLLQVKTQVALAIADQHLLEGKRKEHDDAFADWQRKAELAVTKGQDDLARAALNRSLSHQQLSSGFAQQIEDQRAEAELMRSNYHKLQQKLKETEARCELLSAQQRRARVVGKANKARTEVESKNFTQPIDRMRMKIMGSEAQNAAERAMLEDAVESDSLDDRFRKLEREDKVESLLSELKSRVAKSA